MRWARLLPALVVGAVLCSGCVAWKAPVQPPRGLLVTVYSAPMGTDFAATPVAGRKGAASTLYVRVPFVVGNLLSFSWDDASIEAAAAGSGISQVHYADYRITEVAGVFGRFTTVVHGE